jgi:hypothetical protein
VAISPKGKELIATLSPTSEAIYNEIYQRFGPRNFKSLQELLLGLESRLDAHASAGHGGGSVQGARQGSGSPRPARRAKAKRQSTS